MILQGGNGITTTPVVRPQASNPTNNHTTNYFEEKKKKYDASKAQKFTPLGDTLENILALPVA